MPRCRGRAPTPDEINKINAIDRAQAAGSGASHLLLHRIGRKRRVCGDRQFNERFSVSGIVRMSGPNVSMSFLPKPEPLQAGDRRCCAAHGWWRAADTEPGPRIRRPLQIPHRSRCGPGRRQPSDCRPNVRLRTSDSPAPRCRDRFPRHGLRKGHWGPSLNMSSIGTRASEQPSTAAKGRCFGPALPVPSPRSCGSTWMIRLAFPLSSAKLSISASKSPTSLVKTAPRCVRVDRTRPHRFAFRVSIDNLDAFHIATCVGSNAPPKRAFRLPPHARPNLEMASYRFKPVR